MSRTYRDLLREIAVDNFGYVTTRDAEEAGVPGVELPKLASRNGLAHIAYGLYRDNTVPPTALDEYAEATLRAGEGAYLRGEAVLALLGLADVNPRAITVATPKRTRRTLPANIKLTPAPPGTTPTRYEGVAAQPVADALIECAGRVQTGRLIEAAKEARAEGYLTASDWTRVRRELAT